MNREKLLDIYKRMEKIHFVGTDLYNKENSVVYRVMKTETMFHPGFDREAFDSMEDPADKMDMVLKEVEPMIERNKDGYAIARGESFTDFDIYLLLSGCLPKGLEPTEKKNQMLERIGVDSLSIYGRIFKESGKDLDSIPDELLLDRFFMEAFLNNESLDIDINSKTLRDSGFRIADDNKNPTYADAIKAIEEVYGPEKKPAFNLNDISRNAKELNQDM